MSDAFKHAQERRCESWLTDEDLCDAMAVVGPEGHRVPFLRAPLASPLPATEGCIVWWISGRPNVWTYLERCGCWRLRCNDPDRIQFGAQAYSFESPTRICSCEIVCHRRSGGILLALLAIFRRCGRPCSFADTQRVLATVHEFARRDTT